MLDINVTDIKFTSMHHEKVSCFTVNVSSIMILVSLIKWREDLVSLVKDPVNPNPIHHCQKLTGLLLLRLVSEACQVVTSAWVSIECHWLASTGSHLPGNHHPTSRLLMT